uniref:separase n=1 Tax=Pavo cristatus TaxID=9049 RepID=A0A8C9EQA6_PAVCR
MDSVKQGAEDLRLRTLKEELSAHHLDTNTLVAVLFAELKAYKSIRADTGQERYNVLCDLLEICSEDSGRLHERAASLVELAQVLCYHNYAQQTDCSALDSVHEALRLLDLVPRSAENQEQLLDDRAQALLWLYICTLESKLEEGIAREQRVKALGQKSLEDFEPNDLNYESRLQEDAFLNSGISFNLVTELAQSKSLDDALALWKQLLASQGVPAVRSLEQTVASLHVTAALYRLMAKPLQAVESYLLVRGLCSTLGDDLGTAGALCQVTKLLLQLECPSYAQLFLEETESCLQRADRDSDSYLLLQQTCLVLRSQLYCASHRVNGTALLLEVLQNPALRKTGKVWYMLQAQVLQLTTIYLSLPPTHLSAHSSSRAGWKMPETALSEAHKLLRSIILLLMGSDVLGSHKSTGDIQFMDCGDNVLQKWQVLADVLGCSEHLVVLLSRVEVMCKAKAFCSEAIKLAVKLQAIRWCVSFLVLKAQLELQQSELELSHWNLQQALFLLESGTGPLKILPRKGKPEGSKQRDEGSELPGEDEGFLKGPALEFVAMVSGLEKADDLSSSPQLKPKRKRRLAFLAHPAACPCCLCSDLTLSSLCLHWLLCCARGELAAGSAAEGLGLIQATLQRCGTVGPRFAVLLQDKLGKGHEAPALKLLDDLVATGYATLALHSLAGPWPKEKLEQHLKTSLSFLASCSPHLPSLGVSRASLLLAKATAAVCCLAAKHGGSVDTIFASAWAWQPAPLNINDVFALSDSDSEVPPVVIWPAAVPCTPCQKSSCPPTKTCARGAAMPLRPRAPFTVFSEASPPLSKSQLLKAPKARGKIRSRLPVSGAGGGQVAPDTRCSPATSLSPSCRSFPTEMILCEQHRECQGHHGAPLPDPRFSALSLPDTSSLDTACGFLKSAFSCISHCPPGTLYSQLCQLLALATGDQDPITTAYLLAESVSVTTRHQLLSIIHRKLHKEKKSAADVAGQLQGLTLQDEDAASHHHHLAELQDLFSFSPTGLGPQECTSFSEQLQQIPAGVTVCVLTLVSIQPASVGDTLLLTRLERGSTPITVRIPTALTKTPLSSVLSDFDSIQKEQKDASSYTDKRDWWLCRFELDQRMKNLIEMLEMQVLGCWKAALFPAAQDPLLAEEAARLCAHLQQCGWWGKDPTLLKVVLNAAALLSPADVRALAMGLCPAQPSKAKLLLQEALDKQKNSTREPGGSIILVLDKHLQKLPWESMACLRDLPVTRLPSLRFLLSYTLQKNSVLCRGINPSRTFYILNPQNNLLSTEERFRSWFESEPGWRGVTGSVPSQEQMQAALLEHDLYIYAGHGAGARLLDGQTIAQLQCRAVALLFGCSSAALAVRGSLEGSGIVLKYIMAGCPLVLGNLWDVTDRDIDRYAEALLRAWLGAPRPRAPLLHYVAEARRAPRLQHLIGAAPVAYGLPVSLQ